MLILFSLQGIPVDKQRIIFRGKVLNDDKLLKEYSKSLLPSVITVYIFCKSYRTYSMVVFILSSKPCRFLLCQLIYIQSAYIVILIMISIYIYIINLRN